MRTVTARNPAPPIRQDPSQPSGPDDVGLVQRARAGDLDAFEALYRKHVGRVHAICLRLAGDRDLAEDWTQEVFIRVWRNLQTFRGDSGFATWLHRISVNVSLSGLRSSGRHAMRELSGEDQESLTRPAAGLSADGVRDLEAAIQALPAGARSVFVLHDIEGYRHGEIAELTSLAVGTCKSQLHRARRILREVLSP